MGFAVYRVGDRDAGYGVPAICDHPGCNEGIDRGLSYICGGEPATDSRGCNLYFCIKHLGLYRARRYDGGPLEMTQLCGRCGPRRKKPFPPKPDTPEWMRHKLTDESWGKWRQENPIEVAMYRSILRTQKEQSRALNDLFRREAERPLSNSLMPPGDE